MWEVATGLAGLREAKAMERVVAVIAFVVCVCLCKPGTGAAWYVRASVSQSGDGRSWATAFKRIQKGIDAASDGDTVNVAWGIYVENIRFNGKNVVLTSTNPADPDIVATTIIDGNQAGSVVTFSGTENETCVLSGFTIRNGKAQSGGGIYGGSTSPTHATIKGNTIADNTAEQEGGGLSRCIGMIQNNTITGNESGGRGAGCFGAPARSKTTQ
jgi:hypothetical protein